MKKRIAAFLAAAVLSLLGCLGGCDKLREQMTDYDQLVRDTLAREYSFTADIAYNGTDATVYVVKTGVGDLQVDFLAPAAMEGLSVTAVGDALTARFRGMEVDISAYALPAQSVLVLLREVLSGEKEKLVTRADEDSVTASGSILLTSFDLIFDKDTMKLRQVLIPSVEGVADITEFDFLDES